MEYQSLKIAYDGGICTITINREKAMNALNKTVFSELREYFSVEGVNREDLRGVIITGAGSKAFAAGADIKEFLSLDEKKAAEMSQYGQEVFFLIERFHVPVIAAVNGFALGGGCELAMACHMRIAGAKARFGQPEVNLGICPGYGGTQRLVHLIGKSKAMELLLTADMIKADEAHRLGLANHVVEPGEEVAKAREILEKIATKAPLAIAKTIACVNANFDKIVDGFSYEVNTFGKLASSEDFKEGAAAFIEKRTANFKGK
jgi:enoyl-CoA hydratase